MSALEYRFIEPLDVLFLRGNKLFGDPGSYGECLIPPWPSVAAGAIRSRMLVDEAVDLAAFGRGDFVHATLGTPASPGAFMLAGFYLARRNADGDVEVLFTPPADLVISKPEARLAAEELGIRNLAPQVIDLPSSFPLPELPVLAQGAARDKLASGYWLTQQGWAAYLQGKTPTAAQLVHSSELWRFDARVGIGMNATTRSVEDGKLFSAQAVAMNPGVGFVAAVSGAVPPADGLLRFGGDGRAATIQTAAISLPAPDYDAIASAQRCRIVLTSPGLFPAGWKLLGCNDDNRVVLPGGITAILVSAAVPRAETLSGWDLACRQPKPARRVAPAGSVYWLAELQGTPAALRKLVENGLWSELCEDDGRRAEGFNRIALAKWP